MRAYANHELKIGKNDFYRFFTIFRWEILVCRWEILACKVGDIDMFLGDIDMWACSQPYCHKGFQTPHKYISIHKYYIIYRLNFFMKTIFGK